MRTIKTAKEETTASFSKNTISFSNIFHQQILFVIDFLKLLSDSQVVTTDSGGIQEDKTILGVPCLTLRDNTGRPVTLTQGTNKLVPQNRDASIEAFNDCKNKVQDNLMDKESVLSYH